MMGVITATDPAEADVWIRLESPAGMFTASEDFLGPQARLGSGVDDLLLQLRARRLSKVRSVTVLLPASEIQDDTGARLAIAVRRYCELRLRETQLGRRVVRRDGWAALCLGVVLFGLGLWLSSVFLDRDMPRWVQDLLGNGAFLVIAWVGLWYPLDTLVFSNRPIAREQRALRWLAGTRLNVVPDPTPSGPDWLPAYRPGSGPPSSSSCSPRSGPPSSSSCSPRSGPPSSSSCLPRSGPPSSSSCLPRSGPPSSSSCSP